MFQENITSPLVSGVGSDVMFKNITGDGALIDESFLGTLRALLYKRAGESKVKIVQDTLGTTSIKAEPLSRLSGTGGIHLFFFRGAYKEEIRENLRREFDETPEIWPGWQKVEKVTAFYHRSFPVYCYMNQKKKTTALFILSRADRVKFHALQCAIPAYLPWFFQNAEGKIEVTDLERRLLESLKNTDPAAYMACIDEFSELYHLRDEGIRALVGDIEVRYEKVETVNVRNRITEIESHIHDYNEAIRDYLRQKRDLNIRLAGLISRTDDHKAESPLVNYLIHNRHAEVVSSDSESFTVVLRDYLAYYDEYMAKKMIENRRSLLYGSGGSLNGDDMELLLRAIFIDKKLKMNFCAAFRLDLCGSFEALVGYHYGPKYSDCMPNPHLNWYSCTGEYGEDIRELITSGDLVGAVEATVASCVSLNFEDTSVMSRFVDYIQGNEGVNTRCIVLPDGSVVKPTEAVEYLRKE